jgi:DNA polymerase-3 subunit epsilon
MARISLPGPITVIDFETTGLFPGHGDRVVEVAAVKIDPDGFIREEFVTLVNPERDVSQIRIHGITASDVIDAPKFSELVPNLVEYLDGSVSIAGHNVSFDYRFLLEEFSRASYNLPELSKLCTMRLYGKRKKLHQCCEEVGIEIRRESIHTALADCRASAELLVHLISKDRELHESIRLLPSISVEKPTVPPCKPLSRVESKKNQTQRLYLIPKLLEELPSKTDSDNPNPETTAYRKELDKILADRLITLEEKDVIAKVAADLKLDKESAISANFSLIDDLIESAGSDGVITKFEESDILHVAKLLGIDAETILNKIGNFLALAKHKKTEKTVGKVDLALGNGKVVCFTGEMSGTFQGVQITRETALKLAEEAGYRPVDSVTKKVEILVVADANSQSGKAKKARQYGIQIIHEAAFWNMIGAGVE